MLQSDGTPLGIMFFDADQVVIDLVIKACWTSRANQLVGRNAVEAASQSSIVVGSTVNSVMRKVLE